MKDKIKLVILTTRLFKSKIIIIILNNNNNNNNNTVIEIILTLINLLDYYKDRMIVSL